MALHSQTEEMGRLLYVWICHALYIIVLDGDVDECSGIGYCVSLKLIPPAMFVVVGRFWIIYDSAR